MGPAASGQWLYRCVPVGKQHQHSSHLCQKQMKYPREQVGKQERKKSATEVSQSVKLQLRIPNFLRVDSVSKEQQHSFSLRDRNYCAHTHKKLPCILFPLQSCAIATSLVMPKADGEAITLWPVPCASFSPGTSTRHRNNSNNNRNKNQGI